MNEMIYGKHERRRVVETGTVSSEDVDDARGRLHRSLADAGQRFADLDRRLVHFARKKPLAATCAALAVGFVVGRLLSSRRF